ncbi:4798_t:CDS:2 [Funneliformis geosporum]|uniref:4798_t:CDS:1 n=1 Tax=Funneliformis geosporum TaxID=1117311 RepID=A0A9W4SI84_9GLOM|nr:4798_t:CDS:2 [Funneliformis geosporum]
MTADLTKGLLRDLNKLHEFDEDCNVILKIGRGFDINSFNAHTVILKARSQYFKNALKDLKRNSKLFRKENFLTLEVPHISADAFKIILRYIYTGTISLNDIANQECVLFMLDLIIAADELELNDLVDYLQDYIIENLSDWVKNNLIKIYQASYGREAIQQLRNHCVRLIEDDPRLVFKSDQFYLLKESNLIDLLKRNELGLQEIEIWKYLIKWGVQQDPPIVDLDIKNWDLKVFTKLRDRLSNLIQYIRFFTISAANYFEEIRPYGMVLPDQLKEDIERYYIIPNSLPPSHALPPRILPKRSKVMVNLPPPVSKPKELKSDDSNDGDDKAKVPKKIPIPEDAMSISSSQTDEQMIPLRISTTIHARNDSQSSRDSLLSPSPDIDFDSVLINKHQIKRISRWIDGTYNLGIHGDINNINRFILLTRGNRDGMSGDDFHSRCDNKGPTIVLAKVDKTNVIVGGYNPNSWSSSNEWIDTNQCFIFSFKSDGCREGIDDIILSRIKNPSVAIFDGDSNYDIGFSDLQLFSGKYEHINYEKKLMIEKNFTIINYEVFQVIMN